MEGVNQAVKLIAQTIVLLNEYDPTLMCAEILLLEEALENLYKCST